MIAQTNIFRKLYDLGYEYLVPIIPPDAKVSPRSTLAKRPGSLGKAVGIRGADDGLWRGFDWLNAPPPGPEQFDAWAAMGAGCGIRTGKQRDGTWLLALDIDALEPSIAAQAEALAVELLGPAPIRVGRWPKRLLVYVSTAAIPYQRVDFTDKDGKVGRVELLSDQRQFVTKGIHPATDMPYTWGKTFKPKSELTSVTAEQITSYFAKLAQTLPAASAPVVDKPAEDRAVIDQASLKGDLEHVQSAVKSLPNTADLFPTYDDYIRVGAAIKGATQDDPALGLDLFLQWAGRWEGGDFDEEVAHGHFNRIKPPYGLGADFLYDLADRHSGGAFSRAATVFDNLEDAEQLDLFPVDQTPKQTRSYDFQLLPQVIGQGYANASRPLIKGLLDQGAMTVLYGESNVGKTFVAMDMAFHISYGLGWGGMKTHKSPVVYVVAEGGRGAVKRADALAIKADPEAKFYLLRTPVDLLRQDGDTRPLALAIRELTGGSCGLIVIDTLSRALAGGDENSSTDMGALVKNVDALRAATGAHLLVVHHSGKNKANGARGHSLLRAATDTEIEIEAGLIAVTKQRDLDKSWSSGFVLEEHILGEDEDGDYIKSCTVKLVSAASVQVGLAPGEQNVLEAVAALAASTPGPHKGVKSREIGSYMGDKGGGYRKVLARLVDKGHVIKDENGLYFVK